MSGQEPEAVSEVVARLVAGGIDVVRVAFADLIGIERGRDMLVDQLPSVAGHGMAFCRAIYHTSPQGDVVDVAGGLDHGLPDISMRPDLSTLVPVPWEPGVATCLADAYEPEGTGRCPEDPRDAVRRTVARLGELGLSAVVGPEFEYFLCEPDPGSPTGWKRYADATGNAYVVGAKGDPDGHLLRTFRALRDLGIGVSAANHEFSGGQFEINLTHTEALDAADRAFRFKSAVQELARREGRLATFMAKPFNDEGGSGFHVHLSCEDGEGRNVFADPAGRDGLSERARQAVAGVLAHAPGLSALLNPTINSYKRFGPGTLAPWLIDWGLDNRSAMLRIPPERGGGSRLEIRLGDASANPYLGIAGLVAAVHLGIRDELTPPPALEGYGYDTTKAARLPGTLSEALDALAADDALTEVLGKELVTSYLSYKRDEVARFQRHVTDWEFTEYAYHH